MDVIDLIERDHREVEARFAEFADTGDTAIAIAICDAIDLHARAEAVAVYPVIAAEVPNGVQMAGEGDDEHADARRLTDEARSTTDADRLADLMSELAMVVEEHVDVEETEVLPQARVVLGPERLHSLGAEYEAAKRSIHASSASEA
jgi:Hemerythrin HHE cation binding domain